jgi:phosphonate transport system substrate-binding protein
MGEFQGFFGEVLEAGSHQKAIKMVLSGQIDASAIDSTVLEIEVERYSDLKGKIRIIETFGPSPIPPWVISKSVPVELRESIRQVLLGMHRSDSGHRILRKGLIKKFVPVSDRDYDPIRSMAGEAENVEF